jgi:hypothetical protein
MLEEKLARTFETLLGQDNRLGFSHRIADHALVVQAIHCSPVMSLPGATFVVERQKEQRQHHLVHLVLVIFHALIVQICTSAGKSCHTNRLTKRSSQPLAVAMRTSNFMKQFREFVTLATASGG